jgi:hypothetical protein
LTIDAADEIVKGTLLTRDDLVVHPALAPKSPPVPKNQSEPAAGA